MRKIILMFVMLLGSITNAQTFDFGCETGPATYKTELAAIFASDTPPTELTGLVYDEAHRLANTQDFAIKRNLFTVDLSEDGITVTITSNPDTFHVTGPNGTVGVEYEPFNLATGAASRYKEIFLEVMLAKWNLLYPNYIAEGTIEFELDKIFASSTAPSNDINDYPGIKNNTFNHGDVDAKKVRVAALNGDGYSTQFHQPVGSTHYFSDNQGNEFAMDVYDSDTVNAGSLTRLHGDDWSRLYLAVVTAKWNFLNPPTIESELEAIYAADTPPTELGTIINDAALAVEYGIAGITPRKNFMKSLAYFNVSVSSVFDSNGNPTVANLSNGNVVPNVGTNDGLNSMSPAQFSVFALEVVKAFWHIGHPPATFQEELSAIYADGTTPPVLTDLINNTSDTVEASNNSGDFFKSLGADSGHTVVSFGGDEIGFYFRINEISSSYPKIYSEVEDINTPAGHRAFTLQIIKHIWDLLYPNYVDPVVAAALRTERINELEALDITGVSVAHTTLSNGDDAFSVSKPGEQIIINADWYGPGLVENHTDEDFADLKDAVIASREELNPANAIYEFTPSQFQIASLQEKLDKAYDIAKANDDINAVSGSLLKGIFHGEKITLRIKAKNYPLEYLEEMAHDANYEGWKTLIDRILYLVKTGDGSERTTRENHINGIAGNISVKDLDGGDDDWAVAWNDLPFIYGGSDENDHDPSYVDNNTSRVFAAYHQDNIGLLPGIIYEALLVEVHRINGYVIAADALRRHADGGYNKEREVGLKALTGDAAFHEDYAQEWFVLNDDVTVWTSSKYGPLCNVEAYLWLGVMDNYSFRYMYIIIRNELLRNADGTRYYNNVNQNIYCN